MTTGRQEQFNNWLQSVFDNLEGQYINRDLHLDTKSLEKKHWNQLWRIFENHIEKASGGAKELMEAYEIANDAAAPVILNAHGKTFKDLDWENQMDHYMNSSNYD